LKSIDVVAAEDTLRTGRSLKHFAIQKPDIRYPEDNEATRTAEPEERLAGGENVASTPAARSPAVSDPVFRLNRKCIKRHAPVTQTRRTGQTIRSDIAFPESLTTSCKFRGFAGQRPSPSGWRTFASKGFACCDNDVMNRLPRLLKPLVAGLAVTVLQLAMAVG